MVRAVDKADATLCRRFPALYNIGSHLPFFTYRYIWSPRTEVVTSMRNC